MQERRRRQVLAEVDRVARSATEATALLRSVAEVVATAVPFDRWCGLGFDPSTGLPTSGYHAEGLPVASFPRLLDLEFGDHTDVGRLADVARAERPVVVLSEALGRDPARSARYRDVLEPAGLPHELRVVHREGRTPWGALILFRGSDAADFAADEVHLMELLAPRVAEALRRAQLFRPPADGEPDDGPGVALLAVDERTVALASGTPTAVRRLAELQDGDVDGLPALVTSLARTALGRSSVARCRLRSRTGRWLTLHAERLDPSTVSLVIEPSRPAEIAALLADAYRLTPRESEVVALVVRGQSNAEIARALWLSPWTVGDHLKTVFTKTGVGSRGELTSRLFFDHYLPRLGG